MAVTVSLLEAAYSNAKKRRLEEFKIAQARAPRLDPDPASLVRCKAHRAKVAPKGSVSLEFGPGNLDLFSGDPTTAGFVVLRGLEHMPVDLVTDGLRTLQSKAGHGFIEVRTTDPQRWLSLAQAVWLPITHYFVTVGKTIELYY